MAIQDNGTRDQYTATAAQTTFAYTFEIFDKADIKVQQKVKSTGVTSTLAEGTDYTVTNVGNDSGGNVVLTTGAAAGDTLTLSRDMALERLTDYQNNGDFLSSEVNDDFDRIWAALQQNESGNNLAIRAPVDDPILNASNTELADPTTRAAKALGFDSNGNLSYLSGALPESNYKYFKTTAAAQADSALVVGDVIQLGDREDVLADVGNYTANGFDIIDLTGSGLQAKIRVTNVVSSLMLGATSSGDQLALLDRLLVIADDNGVRAEVSDLPHTVSDVWIIEKSYIRVDFVGNARIVPSSSSVLVGIQVGGTTQPTRMYLNRLKVDRSTIDTGTENIGILFRDFNQSEVFAPESRYSKYNLKFDPTVGGNAYNNYYNIQGIGGVKNFWTVAVAPGFMNENKFYGGRGFTTADTITNLHVDIGSNHNIFNGISVEGTGTQAILCDGDFNVFYDPRTEGTWTLDDIVLTSTAGWNRVLSTRQDLSITDYSADDSNTWWTYGSGTKTHSALNNLTHNRAVKMGANSTTAGDAITISGATQADPVVVTATAHGLSTNNYVRIRKVSGMTELNNQVFRVGTTTANTFELKDPINGQTVDGTGFTAYTSGGYALKGVPMNSIEDLGTGSHLFDLFHNTDSGTSYVFRSVRDSDGLVRSSLTTNGQLLVDRQVHVNQSGYNFEPFRMNNHYFWMNGNDFRGSIGAPTSATDGVLIATLT